MKRRSLPCAALIFLLLGGVPAGAADSAFYPPRIVQRVRANAQRDDWGREIARKVVAAAEPWRQMSDAELRALMFGATLPRSWHVFSNGQCPACAKPVPMYDWKIDALKHPWKVQCPHCAEFFPKNDFKKFHDTGLDERGVFDPKKADRSLLFNVEHPNPDDPKRTFGVDDGQGYVRGEQRWRFIAAYLVYGQWKQAVLGGIKSLATAYLFTGDEDYARRAGVMLARVAELYSTFDFKTQGILYESAHGDGYVSVWHDACIETRELALAFDAVQPALDDEVIEKIRAGILRDAIQSQHKIYSNYPQQALTTAICRSALEGPGSRDAVMQALDPVLEQATAVDGTTGEKGLAGYSSYAAQRLGEFLGYYARVDENFLPELVKRHPRLPEMYRFFIDTWCLEGTYYPLSGDTGHFAGPVETYAGLAFSESHAIETRGHANAVLTPSMFSLLWQFHRITGDPAFAQVLVKSNRGRIDGLPYDLFVERPQRMRDELRAVLEKHGKALDLKSVNKPQWRLAILRSGKGPSERAAWLDYDSGGGHGHADGMNLGLFARGLDLMPDFGYPPVQFGGWTSPRAQWYTSTAAHNTVLIDGANQGAAHGSTTMWAAGDGFSAVSAACPGLGGATQFERTVALVDVSESDFYVLDIARVTGGSDHTKFLMSHFGTIETRGLPSIEPASDFAHPHMRNFRVARKPSPGWSVDWTIEDRYKLLPRGEQVRLRSTDLTDDADAYLGEAWVIEGTFNSTRETWLPRVMTRRRATSPSPAPLASTFVSVIEPYAAKAKPPIAKVTRLPLDLAGAVALRVELADGREDILIDTGAADGAVELPDAQVSFAGRLALIRRDPKGRVASVALCQARSLSAGAYVLKLDPPAAFMQRSP